ncbi:DUF4041 domain-containing protein [Collinsella tanakaei]|uniref:DUF4041 domain-containing protein n=1 Tax=Collinsella tanakaei TaxID=626935 RepID=UPI0025A4C68A|nr:DUF4041 domain-containing protein [Collinsella tanakaei]MDM8301437.1 DUF4041 domain-containing protein [Collinsella tanakaei]
MGISDMFKAKEYKERAEQLSKTVEQLQSMMTPEMRDAVFIQQRIESLRSQETREQGNLEELRRQINLHNAMDKRLQKQIEEKQAQLITFDDAILVQDFGLYEPRFDFANSTQFKDRLKVCRETQKELIKDISSAAAATTWTVNGSASKGKKMVKETMKLLMRAYNGECDEIVRKVKATNINKSIEQIYKTADAINRLGSTLGIEVPARYQQLKEEEVRLAYEFALQKEREKEALREAREQEREARKLAQEIAAARKKLEKEKKQYLNAYKEIVDRLKTANDSEKEDLEKKADELRAKLEDVEAAVADVDYREANQKAGFVYVISNIGSFGENVYKIGMTRRLEPMDRVRELGDASVPFNFDVHAMIFCDDAPKLEAALHHEFEDRKVNIVNQRREFFNVSLSEIEEVVKKNYDKTVEFVEVPEAEQFRTSEELRKRAKSK